MKHRYLYKLIFFIYLTFIFSANVEPYEDVKLNKNYEPIKIYEKMILDGELKIPNDLTDTIRNKSEELGLDMNDIKKRLH